VKLDTLVNGAIRFGWARLSNTPMWSSVTLLLTFRCNQHCAYCDFPRHAGHELTTGEWQTLMRGLRRSGTVRMGLSGGEPLLREDIGELSATMAELGFLTSLTTNGTLLAERLDDVRLIDFLFVTIEGDDQSHDESRGDGSRAATIAGLEAARRAGVRRLGIICPVHDGNVASLEHSLRLAEDLQVRVYFQPVQQRLGWRGETFGQISSDGDIVDAFTRLQAWKKAGRAVGNSSTFLDFMIRDRQVRRRPCKAGRFFGTILPDGSALPCCMLPFEDALPVARRDAPLETIRHLPAPLCDGCSISPYVENDALLSFDLKAWRSALLWK
jgi:MoaA/NifB/PqqE/SkfB family radical SAM enzyme